VQGKEDVVEHYKVRTDRSSKMCNMKGDDESEGGQIVLKTNSGESM
jgi:hypothetical protein